MTKVGATVIVAGLALGGCSEPVDSALDEGSVESAAPEAEPAAAAAEPATVADLFPAGAGRALVLDSCGSCHAVACSAIGQRTPARWDNLKEDHRDKAPNMEEEDLETLFAYLNENFNDSKPAPIVPAHFLAEGCTPF